MTQRFSRRILVCRNVGKCLVRLTFYSEKKKNPDLKKSRKCGARSSVVFSDAFVGVRMVQSTAVCSQPASESEDILLHTDRALSRLEKSPLTQQEPQTHSSHSEMSAWAERQLNPQNVSCLASHPQKHEDLTRYPEPKTRSQACVPANSVPERQSLAGYCSSLAS